MSVPPGEPAEHPDASGVSPGGEDQSVVRADDERQPDTPTPVPGGDTIVSEVTAEISALPRPKDTVKTKSLVFELVKEEVIRAAVALLLILLLAGIVVGAFVKASSWNDTKQLLDVIFPAVTGLLGSALGFYFGKKGD